MTTALVPSLAGARWLVDGPVARVLAALDRDGESARVVGGAVRNALVGLAPGDIDIATTATPDEVTRRLTAVSIKVVPTGVEHGTVTAVADGQGIEVTTLRQDIETDGRRAVVHFGRDWEADARRRDFTINAFSADRTGHVHDPVGGFDDLARRRVRFIGDPATRIREDYLRILRFFRFHAGFGLGEPDRAGMAACMAGRAGIARLSRERVRGEIFKLLVAPRAADTLLAMEEAGLIQLALGSVVHHGSFARLVALDASEDAVPDAVLRLAALAVVVEEDADRLRERLRLANAEHRRLAAMAATWRAAAALAGTADTTARAFVYRHGPEDARDAARLAWARLGAGTDDPRYSALARLAADWQQPVFPIRAADLAARGLAAGPAMGRALAAAEAAWIAAGFPDTPDELARIAEAAARGAR